MSLNDSNWCIIDITNLSVLFIICYVSNTPVRKLEPHSISYLPYYYYYICCWCIIYNCIFVMLVELSLFCSLCVSLYQTWFGEGWLGGKRGSVASKERRVCWSLNPFTRLLFLLNCSCLWIIIDFNIWSMTSLGGWVFLQLISFDGNWLHLMLSIKTYKS